jgi:dienelactone hydrolase
MIPINQRFHCTLISGLFIWSTIAADPIFDLKKIQTEPLEVKSIKPPVEKDGLIIEHLEYTSQLHQGQPIRVKGILAYPKGAKKKPAVFFSMPGMAPASEYWSSVFAKKGYVCMTVTLPTGALPDVIVNGRHLQDQNLTNFAISQLRAITLLSKRPEVDPNRIGIGGSSYGGFFATLIAGADPRIKAGMSFFAGGNHHLGTNLPQFGGLKNLEEAKLWQTTVDPAWRLKHRKVPFLWAVAANDHWFHFPALVQTYKDSIGEKRLAIAPHWAHAFDENMDRQLLDWFEIYLARGDDKGGPKPIAPYLKVGALEVKNEGGKLVAEWGWSGKRKAERATLVVSYGHNSPWHGWIHRLHSVFPASVTGETARAEIPVPEKGLSAVVYGNVFDTEKMVTSTVPMSVDPSALGIEKATGKPMLNGYPIGAFSDEDWSHLVRTGISFGKPDRDVHHSEPQSIRMAPSAPKQPHPTALMKLLNVPEHDHQLSLWLRSDGPAEIQIEVKATPPAHWGRPVVDAVRKNLDNNALPAPTKDSIPLYKMTVSCNSKWQQFQLKCPDSEAPIEGYNLSVMQSPKTRKAYWIDDVAFRPVWK